MSQNPFSDPNFGSEFLSDEEKQSQAQTPAPAQAQTAAQPTGFKPRSTNPYSDHNYGANPEQADGVLDTLWQGFKNTGRAIGATADTYLGDNQAVVEASKTNQEQQRLQDPRSKKFLSDYQAGIDKDLDGVAAAWDATKSLGSAVWNNPAGAGLAIVEQFPNSVPALAGGYLGAKGGAMAGGAVGTAVTPGPGTAIGAAVGGTVGFLAGMFTGNAAIETGHKAMDKASDGEFADTERTEAMKEGAVKAGVITAVDAATLKMGGMLSGSMRRTTLSAMDSATRKVLIDKGIDITNQAAVSAARKSPEILTAVQAAQRNAIKATDKFARRAKEAGTLLAMESVGEGVGEYLGEKAATGEGNVSDAVIEAAMSLGQSSIQAGYNMASSRGDQGVWGEQVSRNDVGIASGLIQPAPTPDNPAPAPVQRPDPANGPLSSAASKLPPVQTAEDLGIQFPEQQDWSQYDRPTVQRQQDRNPQRADDVVSQMVGQARQIGDADAEVRLETANRLYRSIDTLMSKGNEEQARWNAYRADQIIREVSPRLPQAQQAEGAQTAASTLPALITDDGVDLRDLAAQGQERADGRSLNDKENKLAAEANNLRDQGNRPGSLTTEERLVYDVAIASVIDPNSTETFTNLTSAIDIGRTDVAEVIVGRAKRYAESMDTTPGVSESNPKFAEIKANLERSKQQAIDNAERLQEILDAAGPQQRSQKPQVTNEGIGRNTVERTAQAKTNALPAGNATRAITPEQYRQIMDRASIALRTPVSRRTPEMTQALEVREQVRAGQVEVIEAQPAQTTPAPDLRMKANGAPFASEREAQASTEYRDNEGYAEVVPVEGGFAVRVDKARQKEEQRTGQQETAYLPDNTPINTRFVVVDLDELVPSNMPDGKINQAYPGELQPRDRTNANSMVQVRNISANLNPERLGSSRDASTGAPIVGPDGVVESGNGRTMAIAAAYQQGGDRAGAYRKYVIEQARQQGMDVDAVSRLKHPVLVRERISSIDRAEFARRANESQVAGMTAYEQAMSDADMLKADDLQLWEPDQSGDPLAASNRDFQRIFVRLLGNNEAARYTTRSGQASPELGARMQRAVFAKAYRDADMVEMVTEQSDQMRNLVAALQEAAPDLAVAREYGGQNAVAAISTINDAVRIVRKSRQDGTSVHDLTRQSDVFSEPVPETTAYVAEQIDLNIRSRRALADAMRYIGHAVRNEAETAMNGSLFGDSVTNEDIFGAAFRQNQDNGDGQQSPEWDVPAGIQEGEQNPAAGGSEQEAEVEPLLQSYTEDELAERERERLAEEARIAEEQRKTEEKAEADAQVDGFTLSGSNRPADVAASQGQQDLLGGGQVSQPDPNTVSENWKVIGENLQGHEVSENTVTGLRSWKSNSGSNTEQGRIEGDNTYESATDQVIRNRRVQYKTRSEIEAENEAANPPKTSDGREIVEHTTKKGRLLRGVIVEGLNLKQAKAIDQYSFKKGNGFYIKVENWEAHLAEQKPESKPEPKPEPNQETAVGIELDPDEALGGATADGQVTGMADNAPAAGDDGKAATLQKMVSKGEGVFNRMYQSLKKTTETEGVDYLESQSTLGLSQRKNLEVFLDSRGYSRKTNQAGSTRVNVEDNSNEQISITFSPGGSAVMRVARGTAEDSVAAEQAEPGQSQRTYTQQELRNAHRMAASVMHGKLNGLKALPLRQIAKPFLESQGVPVPRTKAETIAAVTDFDRVSALASVGVFNVELSDSVMGPLQAEMEGRIATEQAEPAPAVDIRTEGRENATEAEQAQAENQRPQVSENTIFTEDAAEEARRILMASLGQVNSGIDPKVMQAGITLAGYHIEKGARTFAAYAKAMTNDLGEMVKPYLKSWYMGVKYDPRAAGFDGMDDAATVDAADIDALLSAPATLETVANSQEVGDGTTESEMDQPDQTGVSATAEGRGGFTQPSSTQADTQDLAGTEPGNVEPTASGETDGGAGVRAATENVADDGRAGGSGVSANGRPRTGGSRTPDAGTGSGSAAEGGRPTGGNAAPKPGVKDPASTSPAYTGPGNYHIDNPLDVVGGGQVARFNKNKKAIELFNDIRDNGRTATREEQDILAGYTGWGSFGQELFQGTWNNPKPKAGWEARDAWLREQLGQAEWESMQRSITNAHYTDPPTVMAMWDMVQRMGFEGGRVLEPSMGIGNFYGMMPRELKNRSQLSGIELDMMTGGMAQMLYPDANIKIMGYQESKTPDDFYDVIIGNWPFENTAIADRRYNKFSPMLHDYFFLKTLDQVRPGGIVIGITSKGSMDKKDSKIRSELAKKAELVASFRLPSGAFEEYAGTKVVTDIIILKKRAEPLGMAANEGWIKSVPYMTPQGEEVFINEYYASHPDHVIGTIEYGRGTTFNRPGMIVTRPNNMAEQLQRIVNMVPQGVFESRRVDNNVAYITNHTADREGSLTQQDGKLYVVRGEHLAPAEQVVKYSVKSEKTTAEREQQLRDLIGIRQAYAHLIEAENGLSGSDPEPLRKELRKQYNAFTKANGPLNESWGLQYLKRIDDPFRPALAALESERNGKTVPAAILERSTIRTPRTIDNPTVREAFVLARNESVNPTLDKIAELSGKPAEEVKTELIDSGAVFELPGGDIVPSDIYLSGNVREKMRQAVAALEEGNAAMQHNIDELQKVMPKDVPYFNIEAQLGASWVPTAVYEEYVAHMLDAGSTDDIRVTYAGGKWKVDIASRLYLNTAGSTGFGTPRYNFKKLVNAAFGNQTVTIKAKDPDGNEFVDEEGSAEVNGKISDMRSKFKEWLWQDPDRRLNVEREYNEVRNAYATPRFDGSFLRFDGMALTLGTGPFNLRQHQADAIWRALVTRRSLNAHEVGTGKTFTMGGIAIESRRYGIAKKPLILAHNANSASVAHEIEMMYPAAKVLYIDNLDPKSIERKMRQIANDDWDAVVLPHSQLSKLALREETLMAMAQEDIAELERQAIEAAEEDGAALDVDMMDALLDGDKKALSKVRSPTAKDLVKMRNRVIETIRKQGQKASKANAISFEELGIDMLLVDEAHVFKKPPFATRMKMKGLNTQASDASIALNFLARYVRANNNGGNIHLFTGTPVTNTLTEVFHMMRYIMNEEMQQQDLDQWDGWFNSFASEVMDIELNGAGEYEPVTRLAGFINVPELRKMIGQYMDTVFADDMPEMQPRKTASGKTLSSPDLTELERADLLNGRTEGAKDRPYKKVINESSDLSPEQMDAFNEVKRYAQAFRNMTPLERKQAAQNGEPEAPLIYERIANEASFDVRLLKKEELAGQEGKVPDHPNSKISRAINNILEIYHSDDRATQVVFSDTGLHKTGSRSVGEPGEKQQITFPAFSPIHDMIERLVQAGIPREQIALIAGSNTSKEKRKEIAEKMNRSEIRVVLGSTASLGVGVNMQKNLRAMHHLDAPWMPGDLEQRNGRGHRQGNQWNTVLEYRYLTDRIDGRRWQVLAVKQRFINAFLKANEDSRIIEGDAASDDGSDILESFSEAAGDPRILIRKKMESKLEQMRQRRRLHDQGMVDAKNRVAGQREKLRRNQEEAKRFEQSGAIERAQQIIERNAGANFTMKIGDQTVTDRKTAQELIESFVAENVRMGDAYQVFGEFDGLPVQIALEQRAAVPYLKMDINGIEVKSNSQKVITLENALRALPKTYNDLVAENAETEQNIQRLIQVSNEPFSQEKELQRMEQDLAALEQDIQDNPVAPPVWLRNGAPLETEVQWKGKTFEVTGHRWNSDGWFVLAKDARGSVVIPYTEVTDNQGMPLYEEREFESPDVVTKDQQGDDAIIKDTPQFSRSIPQTDTEAFRQWFGDSKVVDEQGRPLVVYHGTAEDFDAFRNTPNGAFFFDDKELAELYGKPVPAYLSLKNPAIVDAQGQFWNEMDAVQSPVLDELRKHVPKLFTVDHIKQAAQKAGYDGAIILNTVDNGGAGNQYIAFRPEQIKSATGNNGNFDPSNPDIRFSQGESVTGTPLSVADLDTVFNRIAPRLKSGQGYRIFENVRDLFAAHPEIAREAKKQGSSGSDIEGVFHKGQILIVRNKVTSRAQAEALLFHEATHGGVNAMMADEGITKAANRLFMAMGGGRGFKQHMERLGLQDKLRPYIKGSLETDKDGKLVMTPEERRAMLVHELLAFTGEKNSKGIKQKARELIGFIRQWFRKHGYLASSELSTAEISYMVRQARKYTLGGKGKAGAPRFIAPTMFSRSQESGNIGQDSDASQNGNASMEGYTEVTEDNAYEIAESLGFDEVLTHASPDADPVIPRARNGMQLFDGIFASYGAQSEYGNGEHDHRFAIDSQKIAGERDADLDYDQSIAFLKSQYPGMSDEQIDTLYELTAEDRNVFDYDDHPLSEYGYDDLGEASWEYQNIRGKLAADQGFDAIAMDDEFGVSYFIPAGSNAVNLEIAIKNQQESDGESGPTPMFRRSGEPDADLSVVAKAQRTLGNNDRKVWDKVKRTFKRNFTAAGLLPDSVFREKVLRDSEVKAHEFDTAHYIGALDRAISKAYGASYNKLTDAQREALDAQMKSTEPDMSIPEPVRVALMDMRRSIAGLSMQYAEILQQQVEELQAQGNDADAMEKAMLLETIINNMDTYAHRSYRAFDDPDWPAKVSKDPEIFPQAVEYLKNRQMEQGVPEAEAERQAIRIARTILEEGTAYEDMTSMIKESKLGAKDLSILKRRKDIAPEIRALLGEYKDVKINYAKTLAKMSRLVANTKLLDRIKEIGLAEGWLFTEDNKPLDQSVTKVAGDASEVYAPLNGYYVPNEINQALIDTLGKEQMADWLRAVIRMNGLVKYGKTVLSPTTAFRNWMSAAFFAMANGHFDITQMRKSISGFSEYFGHGENPEKVAYLRKLKELGVVYDTAYAGEMMDLLADAKGGWAEKLFEKPGLSSLKAANGLAQKFYQYGDDFWKIMGFENEKAMLMKHKGMSEAEAEVEAAERIRNTYPTYSMTGRAVNWLRRFPLAGTFVSFPAEIIRTQFHMLRYLKQDMKDSPAYAARKVVGLAMVSGLAYAAQALSKDLFDIDDDEEEAVRLMAAEWNSNSNIWFMGRDEDGNLRYLDFSFLDPYNYFKRPINAVMRDQPLDKAAIQAAGEMLSPFFGTDIAFGAISEIWNNKKEGGGRVYNPQDMALDQAQSIANHLRKAIQPGFVGNVERVFKAANDQVTASGKRYKAEEELAAFFGFRASTFDPKTALYYNSFEFKDRKRDATAVLMNVVKDPNSVSDGDLMRAYDTASRSRLRAYTDMIRLVQAAKAAGMNNMQVNASLRRSGISKADIRALMQGRIPAWRPDQRMMRNTIRKAELLYGPDVVREMRERERAIIQRGYRE
jgi:N12 class adenine-specific DNA methylase